MAENLKVNAKSKILTFKKKHNLLVDSMNNLLPPITESDIGKVLVVGEDGDLKFQEISGGTKLYKHTLSIKYQNAHTHPFAEISIITDSPSAIEDYFYDEDPQNVLKYGTFISGSDLYEQIDIVSSVGIEGGEFYVSGIVYGNSMHEQNYTIIYEQLTDTVTPL